jgi:hypothetical protein
MDDDPRGILEKQSCFIATAACGDAAAPEVVTLCGFRDEVLSRTASGRILIRLYDAFSSGIARALSRRRTLRCLVRAILVRPVAWIVRLMRRD